MKKVIIGCSCIIICAVSQAQVKKVSKSTSQHSNKNVTVLQSQSDNQAKASVAPGTFSISDPTIRALNDRANGGDVQISKSGIVGMPKRAYGFANGHLTLFSTSATSTGTITGTGTVGTGSSLGSIGTNGPGMAVNGKSPYAGSSMWGNANRLILQKADGGVRHD